jgi:hypothetical protein
LVLALVTGFAIRLAWVLWTTRSPSSPFSDPAQYRMLAEQFVDGGTPAIAGVHTAFWPPGWPMALAPLVWLTFHLGTPSLPLAAGLLNTVAGTVTVALVASLAGRWGGRAARTPAAWIMAVAAGQVYFTSTMLSETWFTMLMVAVVWLLTLAVERSRRMWGFAAIGLLVGYAVLVRSPGLVLLAAPALVVRGFHGRWHGSLRPTLAVAGGALVLIVPWTVRNGVQVGVWTPMSTNNAAFICIGNEPGTDGTFDQSARTSARCYRRSPFDNPALYGGSVPGGVTLTGPDEATFYPTVLRTTASWVIHHPLEQLWLIPRKTYETFRSDHDGLDAAGDFGRQPVADGVARDLLLTAADAWHWAVLTLGVVALAAVPAARRAWPIWGMVALQIPLIWAGIGLNRYHHPIMPFVVILAATTIGALRRRGQDPDQGSTAPRLSASARASAA